ncbi:retrovirus-related pol polyprotein from transposon TNT 1-94, partial [Tanacetum coccineum]
RYFDVDLTVKKMVKSAAAKMARSKSVYQHTSYNRTRWIRTSKRENDQKKIEPHEEPPRGTLWLKGRVNKDGEYPDDEIRSVGDKLKETKDKIKEGTLKVDHGTDAMTFVLGKEKGGYARGMGSGVIYKSQLDNERRERQEKELLIYNLSNKMSQTEGMVTSLKNQLAAQGGQFQLMSTQLTPPNVSLVDINPINSSAYEEGGTTVVGCKNDASIQKSNRLATLEKEMETRRYFDVDLTVRKLKETEDKIKEGTLKVDHGIDAMTVVSLVDINPINSSADEEGGTTVFGCKNDESIQKSNRLATLEKEMETMVSNKTSPCATVKSVGSKKMTRSIRKDSSRQGSQLQENVSLPLVLPQAIKGKLWHLKKSTIIALGTVCKTDGKQMLHNKKLPNDCYKVSIDTSLVDAACIPDVGNNGFKIVKDAIGGFFAWPKDLVVFDPKATPPSTIQMNVENKTAPKLQTKRKNVYVSSDAMQRQAKKKSIHKSLNY